jgi:hypothetical protein
VTADLGRDISCTTGLRTGRFATKARLVGEAAYRRLTTPRGMLRGGEEEAIYGFDLTGLIGTASTKSAAAALPGQIRAELLKDERIETVDIDVAVTRDGEGASSFVITMKAQTSAGPFTLAVRASEVTVELLGGITTAEAA